MAVASGNQITILQKEDDYSKPCGTFTSKMYSLISLTLPLWNHQFLLLPRFNSCKLKALKLSIL